MSRSRRSAKNAGTAFETKMTRYLQQRVDDRIHRKTKTGAKDEGDIGGLRSPLGERIAIEVKDYGGRILASEWVREAEVERGNYDAAAGVVFVKRRGTTDPGEQFVLMTVRDFVAIIGGETDE